MFEAENCYGILYATEERFSRGFPPLKLGPALLLVKSESITTGAAWTKTSSGEPGQLGEWAGELSRSQTLFWRVRRANAR